MVKCVLVGCNIIFYLYWLDTQWFGVDIGGSLVKCVYFERPGATGKSEEESEGITAMREFLKSNLKYGTSGIRDKRLELRVESSEGQKGTLHFIKFATSRMEGFMKMVTENGLGKFSKMVCATGGGAFKFENDFLQVCYTHAHQCVQMCPSRKLVNYCTCRLYL